MSDEYVPETIIVVDGSLDDIKRYGLCCYAPFGRIYCEKNTSCGECELAESFRKHRENIERMYKKEP